MFLSTKVDFCKLLLTNIFSSSLEFQIVDKLSTIYLQVLHDDQSLGREATKRLLGQLKNFGTTLDNYLHLLLPQIVAIIGDTSNEMDIRRRAVRTIRDISEV